MTGLLILIVVAAGAAGIGIWLGIVLIAPRINRAIERTDASPDDATKEDANGEPAPRS